MSVCCCAGIVESWAAGAAWSEVTKDCNNLDDGDVARLLSRVVDLLDQVAHCNSLPTPLRTTAGKAVDTMARAPITDFL